MPAVACFNRLDGLISFVQCLFAGARKATQSQNRFRKDLKQCKAEVICRYSRVHRPSESDLPRQHSKADVFFACRIAVTRDKFSGTARTTAD